MARKRQRRSIRLQGYDYSQAGAYFITICTKGRVCLFGEIRGGEMHLNGLGRIVEKEWLRSADIRTEIKLDVFQIMPNHLHVVVWIEETSATDIRSRVGANGRSPLRMKPRSLSSLMAGFKASATKQINGYRKTPGVPVWQRGFFDRIIRDANELNAIREYIVYNPSKWDEDRDNPANG